MAEETEMGFLDHLEELRWHIMRAVFSIGIFAIIAFVNGSFIFKHIILAPGRVDFITYKMLCQLSNAIGSDILCIESLPFTIQNRAMTGQFSMHIMASAIIGLVFAFPYAFWEIWRFVRPGLHRHEQKATRGATFFVTVLFMMGVSFGYFIVSPLAINFLTNYQIDASILNEIDLTSYVSTLAMIVLACGVLFQLPIVVFFLAKAGLVTPSFMRTYRKHALVMILVISAIITPPDPVTQMFVALPITILYEFSIRLCARVHKKMLKEKELILGS
ncbi:twin-arginine translocase subunit TatC [Sediminitomix flava]|uniref:Sec-independent protein translocase protein TatC n=1 Tax=Sediminitomix flava TaxID=379075 RepID=A0A315Z126_SEDFL|nr:twin-arginine translocase subunit TatC [Sediminitomix flava]PWJ36124.1 Sec-independent protein translocase TatC [Sediminitomix flava]